MGKMDYVNVEIIRTLRNDSRTPFLKIAKQLKVSEGTIRKRVKDLTASNMIRKFTIETMTSIFGIVGIETATNMETKKIVNKIQQLGIQEIYEVTGRFDIICLIPMSEMNVVNDVLEKIRTTPGVVHTETFTVLTKT